MPVYDKYNFLLLPKMLVLNPKDGKVMKLWNTFYQVNINNSKGARNA